MNWASVPSVGCFWIHILLGGKGLELSCSSSASAVFTGAPDISWSGDECHGTLQQKQNERDLMPILLRWFF